MFSARRSARAREFWLPKSLPAVLYSNQNCKERQWLKHIIGSYRWLLYISHLATAAAVLSFISSNINFVQMASATGAATAAGQTGSGVASFLKGGVVH